MWRESFAHVNTVRSRRQPRMKWVQNRHITAHFFTTYLLCFDGSQLYMVKGQLKEQTRRGCAFNHRITYKLTRCKSHNSFTYSSLKILTLPPKAIKTRFSCDVLILVEYDKNSQRWFHHGAIHFWIVVTLKKIMKKISRNWAVVRH